MLFQRFLDDRRASVAPLLALSIIPVLGLIGAGVDYGRASSVRATLQSVADSTALALAKSAAGLSAQNLQAQGAAYFAALYTRTDAVTPVVTVTYSNTNGSNVVVRATSAVNTMFMGIPPFNIPQIAIQADSTANWGNKRLRVALVLDNTGSMKQGGAGTVASPNKIQALQTAAHNLLGQLQSVAQTDGDVYVSIIPFTKDVNADPANNTQSWVDWTAWEAEPANLDTSAGGAKPSSWDQTGPGSNCPFSTSNQGFKCTNGPASGGAASASTIPSSGNNKGLICPSVDNGSKNTLYGNIYYNGCYDSTQYSCVGSSCSCTGHSNCACAGSGSSQTCATKSGYWEHAWRPAANTYATPAHTTWNGCVTDRTQNDDTKNTAPASSSLFQAEQYSVCPVALVPQSYDWTALNAKIDAMVAAGNTNQAVGLAWGWESLTSGAPLNAPTKDSNYQYQDIIIILSDGLNTEDRWYTNATSIDNRQKLLCDNIKTAGVTIYSIQVDTDNEAASSVLKYCAGTKPQVADATKFFLLTTPSQIVTTFNQIGTGLSKLRLAY
jgi:Flp pilus assembly protein TadG